MTYYTDHTPQQQNEGHWLSLVASQYLSTTMKFFWEETILIFLSVMLPQDNLIYTQSLETLRMVTVILTSFCGPFQFPDTYSTKYARATLSIFHEIWVLAVFWGVVCGFPSGWFY